MRKDIILMTNINGTDYYTAIEVCNFLELKYVSVIYLFRKNNIQKIKGKYYITKEQLEILKNRDNQTQKPSTLHI